MSRRRRKKSWISWLIILVLLVVTGVICYLVWENYFKEKEILEPEEEARIETVINNDEEKELDEPVKKEEVVQYDGENPNSNSGLTGVVTYAGVSGDNLMIRVNIDQYLNGGECMLLLSIAGNTVYSNVARVIDSAATATCEGFNVPMSLLEAGNYSILIEVSSGNKKGIIKGEVNI